MNKTFLLFLFALSFHFIHIYAGKKPAARIQITNITAFEHADEQIIICRSDMEKLSIQIPDSMVPLILNEASGFVASQTDDLDQDGRWDELAFVCNLAPRQKSFYNILLIPRREAPVFISRTNLQQSNNKPVFWNNEFMAYSYSMDGENLRQLHGKSDSMKNIFGTGVGLGAGGIAVLQGEKLFRLGCMRNSSDNIDSTVVKLINKGPVRSIFRIDHYGWNIGSQRKWNVHQVISLWAGRHGYENQIRIEGDSAGNFLVVGFEYGNDTNGLKIKQYVPGLTVLMTHDMQTCNRANYLGLALFFPTSGYLGSFDTPSAGTGILDSYCAKLKLPVKDPVKFYVFSGYECQDRKFSDADYFTKMITHEAAMINMPARVKIER